jgi:hypothetical protein
VLYLTGVTNDRDEPGLIASGVGLMVQPGNSYHLRIDRYRFWAADNGCYRDRWEEDAWLRWLEPLPRDACLFAVAPDVYPDAAATLERSMQFFPLLRELGFPVALVAQDGAEHLDLPWEDFDCLFIGGERGHPEWKVSAGAEDVARRARAQGKWVHMGRVNSLHRMKRARDMGCHSADGTYLKYRNRVNGNTPREKRGAMEFGQWHEWLLANPTLFPATETPALPVHKEALWASRT